MSGIAVMLREKRKGRARGEFIIGKRKERGRNNCELMKSKGEGIIKSRIGNVWGGVRI